MKQDEKQQNSLFFRAMAAAETATDICLVYTWLNDKADLGQYRELMLRKLGLAPSASSDPEQAFPESQACFTFFDPSEDWSREGWRRLFLQIVGISDQHREYKPLRDPRAAANMLNEWDKADKIRVFAVSEITNIIPVMVFNLFSQSDCTGFVFVVPEAHDEDPQGIEMTPSLLAKWRSKYYWPIVHGEGVGRRVRFAEVEAEIIAEATRLVKAFSQHSAAS